MKTLMHFILINVLFLVFTFPTISHASKYTCSSFNATLSSDGIVHLDADCSGNFECVNSTACPNCPWIQVSEFLGCYVLEASAWSVSGERKFTCPKKGRSHTYTVGSLGGEYFTDPYGRLVCGTVDATAATTVTEVTDTEIEITSPSGRVKGLTPISIRYDFKYDNADSCTGSTPYRAVGVTYGGNAYWLPVRGELSYQYDFSNLKGVIKITARACCGGDCRSTDKLVYVDPEDMGNPGDTGGGGPSGPGQCSAIGVGKPVNVANGNVFISQPDFILPGIIPINFTRYYNNKGTEKGGFYTKWRHTFDTKALGWGNAYKIINADGSIFYYMDNDGDGIYMPDLPKGIKSRVIKNPDGSIKREFYDGSKEEFNKYGYLMAVVDRNGNRITLTRDIYMKLTKITDPSGRQVNITYDTYSRINQITLPDGKIISYTYLSGMLQKVTYSDGTYKTYEYSGYNLIGIKNEKGNYIEKHTYDTSGRAITSSADGTNEKLTISYLSDTQSTVTDSLGRVTTYTIDKTGGKSHVTSISGPGCKECGQGNVSYTYDADLNITSKTDANGNITTYTYDSNSNMLTKTEGYGTPQQRTTTYTYEPTFNQVTSITDPMGNITSFSYDTKGNLISTTDPTGATTTFTRNTQGLITQITDALGNITTFNYDQYGNLATITDSLGNVTTYTNDITGKLLSITDANGNQTNYTYDQRSRLKEIWDSLNQLTTYTYDLAGNLTVLTDAKGNTTQFLYDSINRLIKEINAIGKERTYTYDSQSNLTTKKDANQKTTSYIYDNYNRITTINHPDSTQTSFTYDTIGNITSADNQNMIYTFTYDPLNRKTSVTDSLGRTINYTYDKNSNRLSMTDPLGGITQYAYNPLNKITSITDPLGQITSYTYDTLGRRRTLTLPNGITTSYNYDNLSRLLSIINGSISNYSYTYDNVSNRTSTTETSGAHNYTYDVIYRLTQSTHPTIPTEQFSYDPVGNRMGTTVDAGNRLLEDTSYTYSYDNNGNLIQKVSKSTGETITYTYDSENRIIQVSSPGMTSTYKYDPFGRRIEKNVNGNITKYLYDNEDILFELDTNNNIITAYVHGPGIDEPIAITNGQSYYYHVDGLGSIIAITDSTANIVQRYEYDSFGNITYQQDPTFIQPYTYTSREYDPETGLYYYRARYYDARAGRFISEDPIGLAGGISLYAYVGNDPINYKDPLGLDRYEWCGGEDKYLCKCLTEWGCSILSPEYCCKVDFTDCMIKAKTQKEQEACAFKYGICLGKL